MLCTTISVGLDDLLLSSYSYGILVGSKLQVTSANFEFGDPRKVCQLDSTVYVSTACAKSQGSGSGNILLKSTQAKLFPPQ